MNSARGETIRDVHDACGDGETRKQAPRLLVVALTAAAAAALAGGASAQGQLPDTGEVPGALPGGLGSDAGAEQNPYELGEGVVAENEEVPDTDFTPDTSKESDQWRLEHGAVFGEDAVVDDSVTSFEDSLHDVAFLNERTGFAGGSRTIDCDGTPTEVPVMYRYGDLGGGLLGWEPAFVGECSAPGFVGAIAWIGGTGEAIAVGGDGSFPEREPAYGKDTDGGPCPTPPRNEFGTPLEAYGAACDEAGMARAWRFAGADWEELGELPDDMRGLTALDFTDNPGRDLGFAGGLGQLWQWEGGGFTKRYDRDSRCEETAPEGEVPVCEFKNASRFVFRVREIRFVRNVEPPVVFAVTSGCCAEDRVRDMPRLLAYEEGNVGNPRWNAHALDTEHATVTATTLSGAGPPGSEAERVSSRQEMPDSLYSLTVGVLSTRGAIRASVIASPGGPSELERPEGPSVVSHAYCRDLDGSPSTSGLAGPALPDFAIDSLRTNLSTARLVSGDGDTQGAFGDDTILSDPVPGTMHGGPSETPGGKWDCQNAGPREMPDAVPDWAVGELRSAAGEQGQRGLALSTVTRQGAIPETVDTEPELSELLGGKLPTDEDRLSTYLGSQYFALPSYSINSIDVVDPTGNGWAVGEHGAILQLGSGGSTASSGAASEPRPPALGAAREAGYPSTDAYESARPSPSAQPGEVPPLAARRAAEGEPRLVPAGSPFPSNDTAGALVEDVHQIVMSRDGSEGWAVGPSRDSSSPRGQGVLTLFHYAGGTWSRCDPEGIDGLVPPDEACKSLTALRRYRAPSGRIVPVHVLAAARVPLEADTDPSNDDEFEVVAIGTGFRSGESGPELQTLLRYSDGRWRIEGHGGAESLFPGSTGTQMLESISFTAPNDGWLFRPSVGSSPARLLHFDGETWVDCTPAAGPVAEACGDPDGLLRFASGTDADDVNGLVAAGDRAYLYGSRTLNGESYPMVISKAEDASWSAAPTSGAHDPVTAARDGGAAPARGERGEVLSLSVAQSGSGAWEGWAVGSFGGGQLRSPSVVGGSTPIANLPATTTLMRLGPGGWAPFADEGPVQDYLAPQLNDTGGEQTVARDTLQVTLPGVTGRPSAFIAEEETGRIFAFDPDRERWDLLEQPRPHHPNAKDGQLDGPVHSLAADAQGGFWAAIGVRGFGGGAVPHDDFFHYTTRPPAPVFEEAPSPLHSQSESFTALAGAPDGTVLAATRSATLYRYDRLLGWDRVSIPGWDPGRVVTRASRMSAVALGENGEGVVVGEAGRIAEVSADEVRLDRAAGTSCALSGSNAPPCGTARDLLAVDVAPDGSALAAGERLAVLYRPAGGEFRAVASPQAAPGDSITDVSAPVPGVAYLTTDSGQVFRGSGGEGGWSWERENVDARGDLLSLDRFRAPIPLHAIAVDAAGRGFAVGDDGLVLRRGADASQPWERLDTDFADDMTSVALPVGGGPGALIGGRNGLVLTVNGGQLELARPADRFSVHGAITGPVVGLAMLPGHAPGEVEAWAATAARDDQEDVNSPVKNAAISQLYHHSTDGSHPLLDPGADLAALPDVPAPRPGELSFAALGKLDCHLPESGRQCSEMSGGAQDYEVLARRAIDELIARSREPGGPSFVVFTGGVVDTAGTPGVQESERTADVDLSGEATNGPPLVSGPRKLRRFRELVADRLAEAGLPMLSAVADQDLAGATACYGTVICPVNTRETGDNLAWRQAFADRPAPWGDGEAAASPDGAISLAPIGDDPDGSVRPTDQQLGDPDGPEGPAPTGTIGTGGASTHYAAEIVSGGEEVGRLVVVDSSLGSLSASDPLQQPQEADGGQLAWLEEMVCVRGGTTSAGEPCTREPNQRAIVVSSTPTYSYGPGALTDTAADANAVEALLLRHDVDVMVSGALGWNGLYYTLAPGIHEPCPGGRYPDRPPERLPSCVSGTGDAAPAGEAPDLGALSGAAGGAGGLLPTVVASGAGGKFGPHGDASGDAGDGFWHGYTIVRVPESGDPRELIVEQRPVLDWIQLGARTHEVGPRQRLTLDGVGREPVAASSASDTLVRAPQVTRYDAIDSPAITHRYELLLADPEEPWMPCAESDAACLKLHSNLSVGEAPATNDCSPYLCLPGKVGTLDGVTGELRAGDGRYPQTFAVAMLSVGDKSATYPLVFEKSPSFVVRSALRTPGLPLAAKGSAPVPPAPPEPPTPPRVPQIDLPAIPEPPAIAPMEAAQPPEPTPPAPPAPPPPAEQPAALDLSVSPAGLTVATPAAVIQPPTPPVNPAPPSGARREARQRQAAAQKSGADAEEGAGDSTEGVSDLAEGPPSGSGSQQMTRHEATRVASSKVWLPGPARAGERVRPHGSFTAAPRALTGRQVHDYTSIARPRDGSTSPAVAWTAGLALGALALALAFTTLRPGPRRREPDLPAPAWARHFNRY